MPKKNPTLTLNGFVFQELFEAQGLKRLDEAFLGYLSDQDVALKEKLTQYRTQQNIFSAIDCSTLLIECAKHLETFLGTLFNIQEAVAIKKLETISHNPIATFKKYFVYRRAKKELSRIAELPTFDELEIWLNVQLSAAAIKTNDRELSVALLGMQYLSAPDTYANEIDQLVAWCAHALSSSAGQAIVKDWTSFRLPERTDYQQLVKTNPLPNDALNRLTTHNQNWRLRDGFKLTDPRMPAREVQDEIHYCIFCHDHEGDFCAKGFPVKKGDASLGLKKNPLDVHMTGCPLEEKISEMHVLKKDGFTLAALAMVMVDNPMCPATGHRICNDCMKACIYQKQMPVNIPQIETRVLTDVLDLPWGVEIYDLLTRWNPLRVTQWVMKPYNGLKILIAGMGPAGFTLAHHLLLEGFAVVGFDGLKIEPLSDTLIKQPIYHFADLKEALDERLMAGFGGVAEYGITARWDKNFLKLIYLSLLRRPYFQVFGGVRFGGTITVEDAWEMGFDHFAIAVGAGLPRALDIPGSLAPGMRQANDFLMALQLGNAAKQNSLTNLEVRLPAVIIGGGLTGVDTATEIQAYYIRQVEKILRRYEVLVAAYDETIITNQLDTVAKQILNEFLMHGRAVRAERQRAREAHEQPNFLKLIHAWGGVTIVYRRTMQQSPAYIHNHEELQNALREGVFYLENLHPKETILDGDGHVEGLLCIKSENNPTNEEIFIPARSILVATGTKPNTAYEFEHKGTFHRHQLNYQHYEEENGELNHITNITHCKIEPFGPFTSYQKENKRVTLIGDTHPVFHGSIVKAIASGLKTYPKIVKHLQEQIGKSQDEISYQQFAQEMKKLFQARIEKMARSASNCIELTIRAPLAAKHFKPGQFYRLQNFETYAQRLSHTLLQMEPIALPAAHCNKTTGELTFLIQEKSVASKLCATLKPGELVTLMGPTGVRTKMPQRKETILIIGQQSSFAFLRSNGGALRALGHHIIYLCLYKHKSEVFNQTELEAAADFIIWAAEDESVVTTRPQDVSLTQTNCLAALSAFAEGHIVLPQPSFKLSVVDRIFVVGNSDLLRHFQAARNSILQPILKKDVKVFASVYGNMQCMLKGVCAQCLQWQIDPKTGLRTKAVFACSWQDQPLELIDIDHIDARRMQNRLHEQLNDLWINHLFQTENIERI